jgi:trigger factor
MENSQQLEPQSQLSNDLVRVTVHHKPKCRVELEVEAAAPLVQEAHRKAVKAVAKEVSMPGFRKGKAPEELVLRKHPQDVDKIWQEMIAEEAFRESVKLAKTPLLHKDTKITFKTISHSKEGAKLTLTFETEPQLPVIDPKKINLKEVVRPEVNDEKVEETIRQTQLFFAEWKEVDDRPIQEGDFVRLDVDVIDEEPHTRIFSNTALK